MGKKKIDFWLEIDNELKRDLNETKKKMESLLGSCKKFWIFKLNTCDFDNPILLDNSLIGTKYTRCIWRRILSARTSALI
jgi:hypothetical protein